MFFCFWCNSPQWAMSSSFTRFLHHTQRRTTVGRTPLDEWSARRRELYLTTRNTHNWQTSMPPGGIRTHDLSRRAAADLRLRPRGYWDRPTVVCTVQNSWWWTQELSETCRVLLKKIREISASRRFYYKNLSRCTVTWTSKIAVYFENNRKTHQNAENTTGFMPYVQVTSSRNWSFRD